ncbi:hypothetical protein RRG08_018579 [Elysia crispata]|uniref:Uncharacterized protein n=1 Tax=Elysia crispata TaxID=231223 RepID=A0AAE1A6H3_9GAST|nr:hypothetical protein RRG08_018579 [Elysia crispata]
MRLESGDGCFWEGGEGQAAVDCCVWEMCRALRTRSAHPLCGSAAQRPRPRFYTGAARETANIKPLDAEISGRRRLERIHHEVVRCLNPVLVTVNGCSARDAIICLARTLYGIGRYLEMIAIIIIYRHDFAERGHQEIVPRFKNLANRAERSKKDSGDIKLFQSTRHNPKLFSGGGEMKPDRREEERLWKPTGYQDYGNLQAIKTMETYRLSRLWKPTGYQDYGNLQAIKTMETYRLSRLWKPTGYQDYGNLQAIKTMETYRLSPKRNEGAAENLENFGKEDMADVEKVQHDRDIRREKVKHDRGIRREKVKHDRGIRREKVKQDRGIRREKVQHDKGIRREKVKHDRGIRREKVQHDRGIRREKVQHDRGIRREKVQHDRDIRREKVKHDRGIRREKVQNDRAASCVADGLLDPCESRPGIDLDSGLKGENYDGRFRARLERNSSTPLTANLMNVSTNTLHSISIDSKSHERQHQYPILYQL